MNGNRQRTVTVASIAVVFAIGNLAIPSLFLGSRSDWVEYIACLFSGILISQIALLSIWASLGPGSVIVRLPITFALLVLLTCAFLLGLQVPDWIKSQKPSMPVDAALFLIVSSVFGFVCVQGPLWLLRLLTSWRILLRSRPALAKDQEMAQFGLRQLMIWMTVISVLLVLVRLSIPRTSFGSGAPWAALLGIILVFTLFGALLTTPSVHIAFGARCRWIALLDLIVTVVAGPFVLYQLITRIMGGGPPPYVLIPQLFCVGLGAAASTLGILGIIRSLDYRFAKPGTDQFPAEAPNAVGKAPDTVWPQFGDER